MKKVKAKTSTQAQVMRTEFAAAVSNTSHEHNIPEEAIYDAIRQGLVSAYRKQFDIDTLEDYYYVELDELTGESKIMKAPVTKVDEETGEILEWNAKKSTDVTPPGFGRIAAQTAKQVVLQKIREAERDQIIAHYQTKIGEIVTGQVLRMDGRTVILDIGKGQGFMPPEEQMRGEFYRMNSRLTVLIKEIQETQRGRRIVVSRADKELVTQLFAREVPEVSSGAVEVALIAREAGVRTKLAVRSTQEGVDPVGSCVGQRGVRVQEVIRELNNEKLDIIPYTADPRLLLTAALAPATGLHIDLDEETKMATVTAPDDQLSLTIGRGGQNVRLAAKITGYRITVKSAEGSVESEVTGKEEYEIDTFEGIGPELRVFLVEHKLTTLNDLSRFKDKWRAFEDITESELTMLEEKVAEFEKQEAIRIAALPPRTL